MDSHYDINMRRKIFILSVGLFDDERDMDRSCAEGDYRILEEAFSAHEFKNSEHSLYGDITKDQAFNAVYQFSLDLTGLDMVAICVMNRVL